MIHRTELNCILCFLLLSTITFGQTPYLISDFNPGNSSSFQLSNYEGVALGEKFIMPVVAEGLGSEIGMLYNNEVTLLKDIYTGEQASDPRHFVEYKGEVYFSATSQDDLGAIWVTDGTVEGTRLFFDPSSSTIQQAPDGLIVSNSNHLYFTYRKLIFMSDGVTTKDIFDAVDFTTDTKFQADNYVRYKDGIAFVGKVSNQNRLYEIQGDAVEELGIIPGISNFGRFYGLSELDKGLVFSVEDGFDDTASGTFTYNSETTILEKMDIGTSYAIRLHPIEGNKAFGYVRGEGYYLIHDVDEPAELVLENTNTIVANTESMIFTSIPDKFAFTHQYHQDLFYHDESNSDATMLLDDLNFPSEFVTIGHHAFIAFGIFNGWEPVLYYVNLKTGETINLHEFNQPSLNFATVLPVTVQNNTLYFLSNLNQDIGREMYALDLDFIVASAKKTEEDASMTVQVAGDYFKVMAEENKEFEARFISLNGELLRVVKGQSNTSIELPKIQGVFFIQAKLGDKVATTKSIQF